MASSNFPKKREKLRQAFVIDGETRKHFCAFAKLGKRFVILASPDEAWLRNDCTGAEKGSMATAFCISAMASA